MHSWELDTLLGAIREGGEIALRYYDSPSARLKSDRSLVTAADHAIERAYEELFDRPEQGSYLIGEETIHRKSQQYVEHAFQEVAWIVDPIDGTAPYAHHIPTWGISIARMECGKITDGAIYLPVMREVFITSGSEILSGTHSCNGFDDLSLSPLEVVRKKPDDGGMIALTQSVAKSGTIVVPNPVQALACAVVPLVYLLIGRYLGYNGTVKLWDIAGALAMLTRAEFSCVFIDGPPLGTDVTAAQYHLEESDPRRWFLRSPLVCGSSREVVDYMLKAIRQV